MENKVENINIETNKELFEYEMTEVILKLKGEFAAFSGKDTKFAEMVVDDAKLRINTPEVVQVKVEGSHVAPPVIGCVQQTKTACIKVKETVLQLPVIPQISNDDGRKEEEAIGSRKTNVWQGIAVPDLHPFSEITITKESSKKSLEETEREIVSSVEVPQLISVVERTHDLKKKRYVEPVKVQVPSSTIKCNVWNKDKLTAQVEKRTLGKSVPEVEFDSLLMLDRVKSLSKAQGVNKIDIKIPHIVPNVSADIDTSKKMEAYIGKVPQIAPAGGSVQVLPAITCESVQIKVPSMPRIGFHELRKHVVATSRKQIDFQETHSFKYEIKKPTVTREVVTVPELKHIQAYKFDDVCMKHQPILVPDAPKCNNMRKSVGIKNAKLGVMLPKTEIPHVREINIMTVSVPTVSLQGHKTILLKKVAKRNIDIPSTTQPTFSGLDMVEHKQSARKIEIHPVKVKGDLDEVAISYHGVIAIPQKPDVKETVDNIIVLAVAKR